MARSFVLIAALVLGVPGAASALEPLETPDSVVAIGVGDQRLDDRGDRDKDKGHRDGDHDEYDKDKDKGHHDDDEYRKDKDRGNDGECIVDRALIGPVCIDVEDIL